MSRRPPGRQARFGDNTHVVQAQLIIYVTFSAKISLGIRQLDDSLTTVGLPGRVSVLRSGPGVHRSSLYTCHPRPVNDYPLISDEVAPFKTLKNSRRRSRATRRGRLRRGTIEPSRKFLKRSADRQRLSPPSRSGPCVMGNQWRSISRWSKLSCQSFCMSPSAPN